MPQSLILPLHGAETQCDYAQCVEACIMASGCTSSRASVAGACVGALGTDSSIPTEWTTSTAKGEHVSALVDQLLDIRQNVCANLKNDSLT